MALYNNGFPQGYQPYIPQANYQQPQVQTANTNPIIWVQGEAGAKSYLVAPNTTVQLWDSEDQIIYLKSADASGMPSMKIIDYTVRGSNSPVSGAFISDDKYDTLKDEMSGFKAKLTALEGEIGKLKSHNNNNRKEHDHG